MASTVLFSIKPGAAYPDATLADGLYRVTSSSA